MTAFTTLPAAEAVNIDRLTRAFGTRRVLDQLSLQIPTGQFVAILGRSGSGKSTLLRALAGLDDQVQGHGTITAPAPRSVLFQDSRLLPWESVLANVTLGLAGKDAAAAGREALAVVGLTGRENAWPGELSGGEQQRVALARSLVRQPRVLLADEPFGALDALTRLRMQALLRQVVQRQRLTVLLVTHDIDEALLLADRVLVLDGGCIVQDIPVPLAHPRSAAHPQLALWRETLLKSLGVDEASFQVVQP